LALALACDLEVTDPGQHPDLRAQYEDITTQKQAGDYIQGVMRKVVPTQPGAQGGEHRADNPS